MRDITKFSDVVGTPMRLGSLDPTGSSVDMIFAQAIISNEPTTVLEEQGIILVKSAPEAVDKVIFPVLRNKQFTWYTIARDSQDTGSEFGSQTLNSMDFMTVTPTVKTMNVFIPDNVSLINEPSNFETYVERVAVDAKRKKEYDALVKLMPVTVAGEATIGSVRTATSYATGSVGAASLITCTDLVKAKKDLTTGSDSYKPDFVIMHPNQYATLNTAADFAPGVTSPGAMARKAKFNDTGDIVAFDGMDIFVSEVVPVAPAAAMYAVAGHPVVIGSRGRAIARGEHFPSLKVSTQDNRLTHGVYKIFDMSYDHTILVKESVFLLRCADV